jgi:hypothetical protein
MPAAEAYQYALWRLVPDLQRGEALNAGVVLYARRHRFLQARVHVDPLRLASFAPELDPRVPARPPRRARPRRRRRAPGGRGRPAEQSERFHWLVAPASTVVQPGPVHTGLCEEPAALLDRLFARLVL